MEREFFRILHFTIVIAAIILCLSFIGLHQEQMVYAPVVRDCICQICLLAAQHGRRAFSAAADQLLTTLAKVRTHVESNIDRTNVDNILSSLLSASATDQASDYAEAEQLYYSYETLCEATNQYDKCAPTLESIFNTLDDEDNFDPNVLVSVSRNLGGKTRSRASQKIDRNKGRLTVRTTPDQARVRIMNIVPRYRDGIELNIGNSYDIEVSEDGFKTFRTMVVLTDRENTRIDLIQPGYATRTLKHAHATLTD